MGLRDMLAKAFGGGEPGPAAIHSAGGLAEGEAVVAKALLDSLRDQVVKSSKGLQRQAVFSGRHGLAPPIDFHIFDQMFEQTSWVRAVVGVITKAVTAKGWNFRPLRPDADPANAEILREFFAVPNPQDTFVEVLDDITRDTFVFGNAFTEIVYGAGGKPRELWALDAPAMRLRADDHGLILGYVQAQTGHEDVQFAPKEVMHFKLGTKGSALYGLSPLASLILPVTVDKFAQIYNRSFFISGAKIRGAFIMKDATPEQVERNREFLKTRGKDLDAAQADLVLEGPIEFKQIGTTQKDMEFLSLREFTRNEILAVYGVPPAMVSIIETGNIGAGTGDTQRQNFYEETVAPFQRRVAEKITKQVIRDGFGIRDWAFEFNRRTIDEKQQAEILNIYLQAGVLKPEEVRPIVAASLPQLRKAMGLDERPADLVKALAPRQTIVDATRTVVRLENRFAEALARFFREVKKAVSERLPDLKPEALRTKLTALGLKLPFDVRYEPAGTLRAGFGGLALRKAKLPEALKAVDELEGILELIDQDKIARLIERFTLQAAGKGLTLSGQRNGLRDAPDEVSLDLEEKIRLNAASVASALKDSLQDNLRQALIEGISAGETVPEIMRRIEGQLDSVAAVQVRAATDAYGNVIRAGHIRHISKQTAAEVIARTEANRAYNLGSLDALEQAGVDRVVWLLASDACPTCRALSQSVPGTKEGRGMSLDEARDLIPAHPSCRCTVIAETT